MTAGDEAVEGSGLRGAGQMLAGHCAHPRSVDRPRGRANSFDTNDTWPQSVDATAAARTSAGVFQFSVCRGRVLSFNATASSCRWM